MTSLRSGVKLTLMKKIILLIPILLFTNFASAFDVCKKEKKYSQIWYINNCDGNPQLQSTGQKSKNKNKLSNAPQSLKDNNLRVLKDGCILNSQACLLISKKKAATLRPFLNSLI